MGVAEEVRELARLLNFMFWAAVIAVDDLFCRGRRAFAWRRRVPALVSGPSPRVAGGGGWAVVTGANSGIGLETARLLARSGVNVILACRSVERGEAARSVVLKGAADGVAAEVVRCDVADLRSVRDFAAELARRGRRVTLLVNNAGVMVTPWEPTPQGYDVQFGTHHLGHALLSQLLLFQHHKRGDAAAALRVVYVGSAMAWGGQWSAAMFRKGDTAPAGFNRYKQYADVKTAQLLYAYSLADRVQGGAAGRNVTVNTLHPGCPHTPVTRHMPLASFWAVALNFSPFQITSPEAGCYVLQLCTSPALDEVSGAYYHTCGPLRSDAVTYDAAARRECWRLTQEAVAPFLDDEQRAWSAAL